MHANIKTPAAGEGVSAAWARSLVEEIRRNRLSAAWPLVISSRGPGGTALALASGFAGASAGPARTWALTVSGATATCVNCMTMLSTVTVFKAGEDLADGDEMELTASLSGEKGWLCGTINGATKELGLAFGDPPDELDADEETIRFPLYYMVKTDGMWQIALDARDMPRIPGYW